MVLGTVVHNFNLSTQKADTGGSLSSRPDLIYMQAQDYKERHYIKTNKL